MFSVIIGGIRTTAIAWIKYKLEFFLKEKKEKKIFHKNNIL